VHGRLTPDFSHVRGPIFPPGRYKQQIQFALFYGRSIINTGKVDLYVGPIASFAYRKNTLFGSYVDLDSPVEDYVFGLGGKLQANFNLTDKFGISLGSKLMILDYHKRNEFKSIERTNHFDFIRGDAVVQLGLVFNVN